MITAEDARRRVLADCSPLAPRSLQLLAAAGCVTADVVLATESVPPFVNSAMDGYALHAADASGSPVNLAVTGTSPAGKPVDMEVMPGEAVRIMTGAPMPAGADAVVRGEYTHLEHDGNTVVVEVAVEPGDNVRHVGDDLLAGEPVFQPGAFLTPGHLGVLASMGLDTIAAIPRARVGILSTGDELVADGRRLRPGQIRDSNRITLLALAAQCGCETVDLGVVGDDERALTAAIERGVASTDIVVASGGVSVGEFDYIKTVLDRVGRVRRWQVAIRPGKPLAFGVVEDTPVFGLPGNPVAGMVSFELFVRPALRKMMGHQTIDRPRVTAVADQDLCRRPDGKLHLVQAMAAADCSGRWHLHSAGGQDSHMLSTMARANALALLPDGNGVEASGTVEALLLG